MRALLLLFPALLASCGPVVSQREVLGRARAEVVLRESWGDSALILVDERPNFAWSTWKVKAGAMDYSGYPTYEGLDFLPGTERELQFTRNGCLIQYDHRISGCSGRYRYGPAPSPAPISDK